MDRGAWWAVVHRVTGSWTQLKFLLCIVVIMGSWKHKLTIIIQTNNSTYSFHKSYKNISCWLETFIFNLSITSVGTFEKSWKSLPPSFLPHHLGPSEYSKETIFEMAQRNRREKFLNIKFSKLFYFI